MKHKRRMSSHEWWEKYGKRRLKEDMKFPLPQPYEQIKGITCPGCGAEICLSAPMFVVGDGCCDCGWRTTFSEEESLSEFVEGIEDDN